VGLPPTGYISLLLDILFGSFLPEPLVVMQPKFTRVEGAEYCYAIMSIFPEYAIIHTLAIVADQGSERYFQYAGAKRE
jgi:hypothetical protein